MIDGGDFRAIIRTVRIEYPVPYLTVILSLLSLLSLGISAKAPWPAAGVAAGISAFAGFGAVALPLFSAVFRRELLRSERHSLITRALDIILDDSVSDAARDRTGNIVDTLLSAPDVSRRSVAAKFVEAAKQVKEKKHD